MHFIKRILTSLCMLNKPIEGPASRPTGRRHRIQNCKYNSPCRILMSWPFICSNKKQQIRFNSFLVSNGSQKKKSRIIWLCGIDAYQSFFCYIRENRFPHTLYLMIRVCLDLHYAFSQISPWESYNSSMPSSFSASPFW